MSSKVSSLLTTVFMLLLLTPLLSFAASLTAKLDRNQITDGESVNLIITTQGQSHQQPDLSPLDKDFAVISNSTRSSLQRINGNSTATTTWVVGLIPKQTGTFTIPKIKLGSDFTQPLKLTVSTQSKLSSGKSDIFVEVEMNPKEAFVQQQLLYILRLRSSRSFMNVQYMPPRSDDAKIEQLGHDVRYMSTQYGKTYQVIEKQYLVFPQKSGKITLSAPLFSGEVADDDTTVPGVGSFMRGVGGFGRAVRLKGEQVVITVKPKPADFSGQWWLPAENLTVEETFSKNTTTWKVNEPITRTIKITATGLLAEQLPVLNFSDIENVNLYPDKPIIKNEIIDGKLVAQKIFRIAMMPNQNGEIFIPGIDIPWWSAKQGKTKIAKLTSHTFHIFGAPQVKLDNLNAQPVAPEVKVVAQKNNYLLWGIVGFLMLSGWSLSFWMWWRTRKPSSFKMPISKPTDPRSAVKYVLNWGVKRWPGNPPVTLTELARRLKDSDFEKQISILERAQYGKSTKSDWDLDEFWKIFQKAIKQKHASKTTTKEPLPDLY